jgi:hypothetical protein
MREGASVKKIRISKRHRPASWPVEPQLDRRQSETRSEEFIKAWVAGRLPDDAGGFRVCGEVVTRA